MQIEIVQRGKRLVNSRRMRKTSIRIVNVFKVAILPPPPRPHFHHYPPNFNLLYRRVTLTCIPPPPRPHFYHHPPNFNLLYRRRTLTCITHTTPICRCIFPLHTQHLRPHQILSSHLPISSRHQDCHHPQLLFRCLGDRPSHLDHLPPQLLQ